MNKNCTSYVVILGLFLYSGHIFCMDMALHRKDVAGAHDVATYMVGFLDIISAASFFRICTESYRLYCTEEKEINPVCGFLYQNKEQCGLLTEEQYVNACVWYAQKNNLPMLNHLKCNETKDQANVREKMLLFFGYLPEGSTVEERAQIYQGIRYGNGRVDNEDLQEAFAKRNKHAFKMLLQNGADANLKPRDSRSASMLEESVRLNFLYFVDVLLKAGADINCVPTTANFRGSLLSCASVSVIQLLLNAGLDINIQNDDGETELFRSVYVRHLSDMKFLLCQGAKDLPRKRDGYTALHYAVDNGLLERVKELIRFKENSVEVNAKDNQGRVPFHLAKTHEMRQVLLDAGADIDAQDNCGRTVLFKAVYTRHIDEVRFLLSKGARDLPHQQGETALRVALVHDLTDYVDLLISHGSDIHYKNKQGVSPFSLAASSVNWMTMLLNSGVYIDTQDSDGETALLKATKRGAVRVVEFLLWSGARDLPSSGEYSSALDCVCKMKKECLMDIQYTHILYPLYEEIERLLVEVPEKLCMIDLILRSGERNVAVPSINNNGTRHADIINGICKY